MRGDLLRPGDRRPWELKRKQQNIGRGEPSVRITACLSKYPGPEQGRGTCLAELAFCPRRKTPTGGLLFCRSAGTRIMSAHAGGVCMSQCGHWRIPLFCFPVPRKGKQMQTNPRWSTRSEQGMICPYHPLYRLSTKPKGFADRRGFSLLRALACGRRSHTCRLQSVFSEVHAPGKHGLNFIFRLPRRKTR